MNEKFVELFTKLVTYLKKLNKLETDPDAKRKNQFRIGHLTNSLKTMQQLDYELSFKTIDKFNSLPGIGKGTVDRVIEILETNELSELNDIESSIKINSNKSDIIADLTSVVGIGEKRALELINEYKITSIEDLKKRVSNGTVKVNDKILLGIKYHGQYEKRIPRAEIDETYLLLHKTFCKIDPKIIFVICGSYRRGNPTSGDIDILMVHEDIIRQQDVMKVDYLQKVVNSLHKDKFLVGDLTDADGTKYMGFSKYKKNPVRRIDIRMVGMESFFPALLYFTGSYEFNQKMRQIAKRKGYKLNEYGLYDSHNTMIRLKDEKEAFNILGMKYLEPHER